MTTTVPKYWIVGAYVQASPDAEEINPLAGPVTLTTYPTLLAAQNACKLMAAAAPSSYFVVYEHMYWSHVDASPVNLLAAGLPG